MSEGNKLFVGSHNIKMQHAEGHGVHIRRLLALAQVNDGAVSLALGASDPQAGHTPRLNFHSAPQRPQCRCFLPPPVLR